MDFSYLFEPYDSIVSRADDAFQQRGREFPECIRCEPHCADCCHAVFGLFLIEAVFLKHDFDRLNQAEREAALQRGHDADKALEKLEGTVRSFKDDPQMISYALARARIRCPLLNDQNECILYPYRPITCRVYGIPTKVRGVSRVCGKAGFKKEATYPVFDLDEVHRELYQLSKELLQGGGHKDLDRASLLLSVSKVIQTPVEELMDKLSGGPETTP
ncbi:MAG: YkgJ family cysteine cluster protein [Deltaproteobacteria bacterium]|nr:YkgJ family cysteine cluster protein [Deltaproteobacteria bacterium]